MLETLFLIFLVLKLAGLVTWSWTFTLIPLWIWLGLVFLLVLAKVNQT